MKLQEAFAKRTYPKPKRTDIVWYRNDPVTYGELQSIAAELTEMGIHVTVEDLKEKKEHVNLFLRAFEDEIDEFAHTTGEDWAYKMREQLLREFFGQQ